MMNNCDLLVFAPHYRVFIKDLTDALAPEMNRIDVVVHHNRLAELAYLLPDRIPQVARIRRYTRRRLLNLKESPRNVFAHLASLSYLRPDGNNKKLGDRAFRAIEKMTRKLGLKPDLLHSHFAYPSGFVGSKFKEKHHVPLVITVHGYDAYDLPYRDQGWRQIVESTLRAADVLITVSNSNRERIHEVCPDVHVEVIPNGFRQELFFPRNKEQCREALGLPQSRELIVAIGNLVPGKGHRYLIEAIQLMSKTRSDVSCIIVGAGILERKLRAAVTRRSLGYCVSFAGERPHTEIPLWINAADVVVLPSLHEGIPTVMFETLGCGVPFVGTTVGGVPEVIVPNENGLLCPPGDSQRLADCIEEALNARWDRQRIAALAMEYSWDNIAKRTLAVYSRLLR